METDVPDYLIAPPGTPVGAPGWRKPPPGFTATWTLTEGPDVAIQRDGILLADGRDGNFAGLTVAHYPPSPVSPLLEEIAAALSDERLTASCPHLTWWWGDRGDHGCTDCPLTHQFPHAPGENPADCEER